MQRFHLTQTASGALARSSVDGRNHSVLRACVQLPPKTEAYACKRTERYEAKRKGGTLPPDAFARGVGGELLDPLDHQVPRAERKSPKSLISSPDLCYIVIV